MLSFARFMELSLYCPVCGYYETEKDNIGQRGDFYTSVSVGGLFGELLAFQFARWLEGFRIVSGKDSGLRLVEAGAHDGRLAKDILTWLQRCQPALLNQIEYWIVEPSAVQRSRQQTTLHEFGERVRWSESLAKLGDAGVCGVIFSNELLDAMPVHRVGWDAARRTWFEWGVTWANGRFEWGKLPDEKSEIASLPLRLPEEFPDCLPDGFTTEICPAAENWWREAAAVLKHGKLLTIDYGLNAEEFFMPQRSQGTLRAYHRHRQSDDVLANAGEQDITAHVNFTAIQKAGESAGLKTETFVSQAQFFTRIAERIWQSPGLFGEWTAQHTRQFQTLTHPEHLGRAFRVLVQAR